jgi:biotin synthase-related radical SAM superfamily protein
MISFTTKEVVMALEAMYKQRFIDDFGTANEIPVRVIAHPRGLRIVAKIHRPPTPVELEMEDTQ